MPTQAEVEAIAGPIGAREFFGAEEWDQEKTWEAMQAIPDMDRQEFLDGAESAIMGEAILQNYRGNHGGTYALCSAFYWQSRQRSEKAGHSADCASSLYSQAHANAMRSQGHKPGQTACTCERSGALG